MFVLDTHVISELRHGKLHQSPEVRAWAGAQPASRLYLSAITILELEMGIQALEHRFTVVTRNTVDFVNTGVALVNPWVA